MTRERLYLLYHELKPGPTAYTYALAPEIFAQHLDLFRELQNPDAAGSYLPELTFDDGHRSDYEFALPALVERGMVARFFITAGWTGTRAGFMDWSQLRALRAAGQQIGAHSMTHALLTHYSAAQLGDELAGARKLLEDGLGEAVTTMSLPGGRSNRRVLESCREAGYTTVYTSLPQATADPRAALIGRLNVRSTAVGPWLARLLQPATGVLAGLERQARLKSQLQAVLGDRLYARLWAVLNRQAADPEPATETTTA